MCAVSESLCIAEKHPAKQIHRDGEINGVCPRGLGKQGAQGRTVHSHRGAWGKLLECSGMRLQWWCATKDLLKKIEFFSLFLEKVSQSAVISQ